MKTNHTSGPWKIDDHRTDGWRPEDSPDRFDWHRGLTVRKSPDNTHIATVGHMEARHKDEAEANALLMCAAPQLLQACMETLTQIENETPRYQMAGALYGAPERLRDAIEQATGQTWQ